MLRTVFQGFVLIVGLMQGLSTDHETTTLRFEIGFSEKGLNDLIMFWNCQHNIWGCIQQKL